MNEILIKHFEHLQYENDSKVCITGDTSKYNSRITCSTFFRKY